MITNQQKLTIMRQAEINPGLALLTAVGILRDEMQAQVTSEMAKIEAGLPEKVVLQHIEKLKGEKGEPGDSVALDDVVAVAVPEVLKNVKIPQPKDGETPSDDKLLAIIKPLIPQVKDGETPSESYLLSLVKSVMPDISAMRPTDEEIRVIVADMIPEEKEIDMDEIDRRIEAAVKGISIDASQVRNLPKPRREKSGKYMHGGGPTILQKKSTETIASDGSQTVFTPVGAAGKPSFVVVDYAKKPPVAANGYVNWTWNPATGKVTLTTGPQEDIFFEA